MILHLVRYFYLEDASTAEVAVVGSGRLPLVVAQLASVIVVTLQLVLDWLLEFFRQKTRISKRGEIEEHRAENEETGEDQSRN